MTHETSSSLSRNLSTCTDDERLAAVIAIPGTWEGFANYRPELVNELWRGVFSAILTTSSA